MIDSFKYVLSSYVLGGIESFDGGSGTVNSPSLAME